MTANGGALLATNALDAGNAELDDLSWRCRRMTAIGAELTDKRHFEGQPQV
jgi:hypothetical protein